MIQIELERQRLGRELHTGVGQVLAAIRLQVEAIEPHHPALPNIVRSAFDRISALAEQGLAEVRSLSRMLHPPDWQRLKTRAALLQLWELTAIPERFEATVALGEMSREPSLAIKILLYRALQEALSNIIRHSQATRVGLQLEVRDDRLILRVQDDGIGFEADTVHASQGGVIPGIGLRAIREHAELLGASLTVESGAAGTLFQVSAPFTEVEPEKD